MVEQGSILDLTPENSKVETFSTVVKVGNTFIGIEIEEGAFAALYNGVLTGVEKDYDSLMTFLFNQDLAPSLCVIVHATNHKKALITAVQGEQDQ